MQDTNRLGRLLAATVTIVLALPASAATLDDVIAKHVEAKGGAAAWEAIDSLKFTGTFTAFSKDSDFTMHRGKGDRYHLSTEMNGHPVIIGNDGQTAWWDHGMRGPGAKPIAGPDLAWQTREFDFTTPLMNWKAAGHKLELVGESEYEGMPALEIKLTRADESEETWYLDPGTYLEMARVAPGSDFGRPMPARTFFDDFRDVNGVQIPHLVESQWYTRDRVFHVANVEANVALEDKLFNMPAPRGMEKFVVLAGKWKVKVESRQSPQAPFTESERDSTIELMLRGAMLQEKFATSTGNEYVQQVSYDQYAEKYRITSINTATNHLNVLEGTMADGKVTVDNTGTKTTQRAFGNTEVFVRSSYMELERDSFRTETEASIDGGETWFVASKSSYTRAE